MQISYRMLKISDSLDRQQNFAECEQKSEANYKTSDISIKDKEQ